MEELKTNFRSSSSVLPSIESNLKLLNKSKSQAAYRSKQTNFNNFFDFKSLLKSDFKIS